MRGEMNSRRLAALGLALLALTLSGCIGAWFGRDTKPRLFLSSPANIGDEWEIVLSVAKMPQGGLAAIHVHPGGLFYSPGGLSRLDVQGLNGFIAVASHVDEDGKASFILLNVAAGVETGDIARLTFVPSREAQGGDFILVNSLIELVGDQLSPIGQWIVGSPS
jgi:hypothetical protein